MEKPDQEKYHELAYYTLALQDASFIHQHVVDAYAVQNADETTKPIAIVFGLVGLYLYLEKDYTGRQVQQAHMQMAKKRKNWQSIELPVERGKITISDVLTIPPGKDRDAKIKEWCESVWAACNDSRKAVIALVNELL